MKISSYILNLLAVWLLVLASSAQSQTGPEGYAKDLEFVENLYSSQRSEAAKPIDELNAKYRAALEKQSADFQSAGNLDGVLETRQAMDEIAKGALPDGKSKAAAVEKIETVYLQQRAEVQKSIDGTLRKADQDYVRLIDELSVRLTKANQIDEAIKVRDRGAEIRKRVAANEVSRDLLPSGPAAVKIISARYGTGGTYSDVTAKVKEMIEVKRETFWASPQIFGGDPVPYYNKSVNVKFSKDGVTRDRWWDRDVPLRVEDFYGPQDKDELRRWLIGTKWKAADVEISFNANETFTLSSRLGAYQWSVPEFRKVRMEWSAEGILQGKFDETWTTFTELSDKKRTFRKIR